MLMVLLPEGLQSPSLDKVLGRLNLKSCTSSSFSPRKTKLDHTSNEYQSGIGFEELGSLWSERIRRKTVDRKDKDLQHFFG
jgi:hypothetical protein